MYRRITGVLCLCICLCLCFFGCSNIPNQEEESPESSASESALTEKEISALMQEESALYKQAVGYSSALQSWVDKVGTAYTMTYTVREIGIRVGTGNPESSGTVSENIDENTNMGQGTEITLVRNGADFYFKYGGVSDYYYFKDNQGYFVDTTFKCTVPVTKPQVQLSDLEIPSRNMGYKSEREEKGHLVEEYALYNIAEKDTENAVLKSERLSLVEAGTCTVYYEGAEVRKLIINSNGAEIEILVQSVEGVSDVFRSPSDYEEKSEEAYLKLQQNFMNEEVVERAK